jgi:hypothetical protein
MYSLGNTTTQENKKYMFISFAITFEQACFLAQAVAEGGDEAAAGLPETLTMLGLC